LGPEGEIVKTYLKIFAGCLFLGAGLTALAPSVVPFFPGIAQAGLASGGGGLQSGGGGDRATFNSTAASGANAFTCTTAGCRLSLGDTSRYLIDDGGGWTFNSRFASSSVSAALNLPSSETGTSPGGSVWNVSKVYTYIHKISRTHADLTAAATTEDETVWTIPAKTRVLSVVADVTTPFTGGTVSAVAVTCGSTAGGNNYLVSFDALSGAITRGDALAEMGAGLTDGVGHVPSWSGTTVVSCRFTTTGGNAVDLTAGEIYVYLEAVTYP
jgi:hypothetical protein